MPRWVTERMIDHVAICPAPQNLSVAFAFAWFDENASIQTETWACPVVGFETIASQDYSKEVLPGETLYPERAAKDWDGAGWDFDGNFVNRGVLYVGESGRIHSTIEHEFESEGPVYKIFQATVSNQSEVFRQLEAEAITNLNRNANKEEPHLHE